MRLRILTLLLVCVTLGWPTHSVFALDPCGMVPPIYTGPGVPIVRTGLQQTYVFYKDGVETFVIRPGFQGRVEDFGMLIPFPTPPALRKVPDNVFEQLDNAIDPPEVVVDLRLRFRQFANGMANNFAGAPMELEKLSEEKVVVLKEEAVGMYEVAVLAAGSAQALKGWMDKHKYQYPDGMDKVTGEYIEAGWCFVAVKTKVGRKAGANPQPGQRKLNTSKPADTIFDGTVQGMGFRFKTDKLVVPMRLSAFNDGDLRNVVYLLTDGGKRIRHIPEEYVVRQIRGDQLIKNLTQPLPLRVIGDGLKDIPEWQRKGLKDQRNPEPKNGVAKTMFSADLLAVSTGNLSLEMEEAEKNMLAVGEFLGLRGAEYDTEIAAAQKASADRISDQALADLSDMTLTVVDGDFPRSVIAGENLTFANFRMPAARNHRRAYDCQIHGVGQKRDGTLISAAEIDFDSLESEPLAREQHVSVWLMGVAALLGLVVTQRIRKKAS